MDQELQDRVYQSARAFGLKTPESAVQFLSQAESPEDWHLRIKYIAAWTGDPTAIPASWWEVIRRDAWVLTTAVVLGVIRDPVPGVEVENIEIRSMPV